MKYLFLLPFFLFLFFQDINAQYYFPPNGSDDWETTGPEELGWCPEQIDTLYQVLEEKNTKAFIVLKEGKIVLEKYFGTFEQDSIWYWASAGKTLTAFLTGVAQQEGDLSLTDKTSDYLGAGWTECPPEKEDLITIWHQLSMTSGMDDSLGDCLSPDCLQYVADAGTRWSYHNPPYRLLWKVLEAATGTNYNIYTLQKLLNPTGMDGLWLLNDNQTLFLSRARSMARFGSLIMNEGTWDGTPIMTDSEYFEDMVNTSQDLNKSYGYLWWLNGKESYMLPSLQFDFSGSFSPNAPDDLIIAAGKNGQFLNVIPSQDMVVVRMGNAPDPDLVPITFHDEMWVELNKIMCSPTSTKGIPASKADWDVLQNPFDNQLIIKGLKDNQSLQLIDFWGRSVATSTTSEMDTSSLPIGIYFLQLMENGKVVDSKRVVK